MKPKKISCLLTQLIALIVSSCNDDIFIDERTLPDSLEISIEGDGGYWSTYIPRDGLINISMYNPYRDTDGYLTYQDVKGNSVAPDCPVSDLGAIIFESPAQHYVISFYGRKLDIKSYYNSYPSDMIVLVLEYDYGMTNEVRISFTEGKPLYFLCRYEGEMTIENNVEEIAHRTSFENNSSLTQKFVVYPFINCNCSYEVMPDENWAIKYQIDEMPVPAYSGKRWELMAHYGISLGDRSAFSPSGYIYENITVDVPPYTKASVNYNLYYSRASQKGLFIIKNVVADREFEMGFNSTATYATRYDFTVDYE